LTYLKIIERELYQKIFLRSKQEMQNWLNHVKNKEKKLRRIEPQLDNLHMITQKNTSMNTLKQMMISSKPKELQKHKDNSSLNLNLKSHS
jgi:hypothetical protein